MLFADRVAALREMRRVLRPGGRLAVMKREAIERCPSRAHSRAIGTRHFGGDKAAAFRGQHTLSESADVRAPLREAGFRDVAARAKLGTVRHVSPEAFAGSTGVETVPRRRPPAHRGYRRVTSIVVWRGSMSAKAEGLAGRFERANEGLIATVAGCDDAGWRSACPDTGWRVAIQADHLAAGEAAIADVLGKMARGEAVQPLPMAAIEQANEQRAARVANTTRDEVVALLRRNGADAAATYRGLSDEQLGRTGQFVAELPAKTVEEWVEYLAIGELERHGGCIRQALGR